MSAWTSSAARAELYAASASLTWEGRTERALAVESVSPGTKTTGTMSGCSGTWTVVVHGSPAAVSACSSLKDRVIPP